MADSQRSNTKFDIFNPHEVMARDPDELIESDNEYWNKIHRLAFIVVNPKTQADQKAAFGYLRDLVGVTGSVVLTTIILYYKRHCPDIHFPYPSDISDELESLISNFDKPEQR